MDDNNQDIKKALDEIFGDDFIEIDVKKENKDEKDGQNENKKTSFNNILIISIIIGFLLGVLVIFIVIDNVFYKEKVTNC